MLFQNFYIIDDDFMHRNTLLKILEKEVPSQHIYASEDLLHLNEKTLDEWTIHDEDVFFIDIDLKQYHDGIFIADFIRKQNARCFIIFVSSDPTKGMEIINKQIVPFNYLTKNKHLEENVHKLLNDVKIQIKSRHTQQEKVGVEIPGSIVYIAIDSVDYMSSVKGKKNHIMIHKSDEELILPTSLKVMREKLADYPQFLLLKSFIINLDQIVAVNRIDDYIQFSSGTVLYVGKKITAKVKAALQELGG